ncbi:MAG: hypothetical protein U5M51_08395 [Emticicia sp.]|nr:hypothetical protein [Emticicia sp.]
MKKTLIIVFCCLATLTSNAQKTINFTQQLTFEYVKDGKKAEFSVFVEPKTSTWLLTKDDTFLGQPDDINYWILTPDGKITIIGNDERGKTQRIVVNNPLAKKFSAAIVGKKTGKTKVFGQNKYGWKTFRGEEYALTAGRASEKMYLAKMPFNCHPLMAYNSCLEVENHLPIFSRLEYPNFLPRKFLVVEETISQMRLVSVSPTEYFIDLPK